MSQLGRYFGGSGSGTPVEKLTGNSGGPITPDGSNNINVVGDGTIIDVIGDLGTNTLTITPSDAIATTFTTDDALTAIPSSNNLNIVGDGSITTSSSGDTLTISFATPLTVAEGGTGVTSLTDHGVLLGSGISGVTVTSVGANGQILIGATGGDPAFGTLTSTASTVTYTTGANSLNIDITAPVTVPYGGTGIVTTTAYAPICGGTTATGAFQAADTAISNSGYVLTSTGSSSLPTWQATATAFTWSVATGSTQACAVNTGYFANYNGTLAFTLPSTAAVGDTIQIAQMYAGQGWTVAVNSGETIYIGNTNITTTSGTLASTDDGDWIELVCRVADTDWQCNVKSGNITVT